MTDSPHIKRMKEIRIFAAPPKDSASRYEFEMFQKEIMKNPKHKKKMREIYKTAYTRATAQFENGAGFIMDRVIRDFALEYNGRNFQHGLNSMPSLFNIAEAFLEYIPKYSFFRIYNEYDSILSFTEFVDFLTMPSSSNNIKEVLECTEENAIYSYNILNKYEDFIVNSNDGQEFVVGGVSLVRHKNEVSVILLAGEKTNLIEKTAEIKTISFGKPAPGREKIKPAEDFELEAVPMIPGSDYWKLLVMTRISLDDMTFDTRYIAHDIGKSYSLTTDDIRTMLNSKGEFIGECNDEMLKSMNDRIVKYASLFELCKTFLYLPIYFEENMDNIEEERHETSFGENVKKKKWILKNKFLTAHERVRYRNVKILYKGESVNPSEIFIAAPEIKLEVSGYWKRLPHGKIGSDKKGNPIHSRTWVEKRLTWLENDAGSDSIHITSHNEGDTINEGLKEDSGRIYVMRSAAHANDIFKIGLTRRTAEERSRELSSTTGSPDKFLVAQEWKVKNCSQAEKIIHKRLNAYRLNPKREFFNAPYSMIVKTIEDVIAEIE